MTMFGARQEALFCELFFVVSLLNTEFLAEFSVLDRHIWCMFIYFFILIPNMNIISPTKDVTGLF